MRTLLYILLLFCSAYVIAAQQQDHRPYLVERNTRGEKLFFIPSETAATVETLKGYVATGSRRILDTGLRLLPVSPAVPETELYGNFTLYGREHTTMASGSNAYSYTLYTFNQLGEFLYHPYMDHNGFPDSWQQGRRRIVAHGKMGMADRRGRLLIPARDYSYLLPARWGLVIACKECQVSEFDYAEGRDTGAYRPGYRQHRYDIYSLEGKLLQAGLPFDSLPQNPGAAEALLDDHGIAYKGEATALRLSAMLLQLPEVKQFLDMQGGSAMDAAFVLYDRPSAGSPYFLFGLEPLLPAREPAAGYFLVSPDGKDIYNLRYDLQLEMPYEEWRKLPEEGRFADNW